MLSPDAATATGGTINYFASNFQAPTIHQYDVIIERQIMKNTVVSASYIGSLGRHLPTFFDLNNVQTGARTYTIQGGPFDGRSFDLPVYSRAVGSQSLTRTS